MVTKTTLALLDRAKRDAEVRTHTLEQVETMLRERIEDWQHTAHHIEYHSVRCSESEEILKLIQQMKEQQP